MNPTDRKEQKDGGNCITRSFIFVHFVKCYCSGEDLVIGTCSAHGMNENYVNEYTPQNLKKNDYLRDIDMYER
jgi:hypothetical protein